MVPVLVIELPAKVDRHRNERRTEHPLSPLLPYLSALDRERAGPIKVRCPVCNVFCSPLNLA